MATAVEAGGYRADRADRRDCDGLGEEVGR